MQRGLYLPVYLLGTILILGEPASILSAQQDPSIQLAKARLEKILKDNIVDFWLARSIDRQNGGYILNIGPDGQVLPGGTKMIVTQARMLWLFSRLIRAGYGSQQIRDAAGCGYAFLRDAMWDSTNGGFYWEVDITGKQRLNTVKHMYGQAFALYAISEYYLALKDPQALGFANRIFELMDSKAHDNTYGGYRECFNADWSALTASLQTPMGSRADQKLMNTHLHLLEAFTTYYRASRSELARTRLIELIFIQTNSVIRKNACAATDEYTQDWRPTSSRVSYGHDIENIWLVIDACNAVGLSNYVLMDFYKALFDYSYRYGYDNTHGGFYESGQLNLPADRQDKIWWVQAEALVCALHLYRLTGQGQYLMVFAQTLDFIEKYIVDWTNGEWHERTSADGTVRLSNKGHTWKCGYHNGRAMIECIEILKGLKGSVEN